MKRTACSMLMLTLFGAGLAQHRPATAETSVDHEGYRWAPVAGTAVHYFTTAMIHSVQPTPNGLVQTSTDLIELDGDLRGRILYHPTSAFDFVVGSLVNTGDQVFSGTVLGFGPVMIHDDRYRFEVDLATGATQGEVFLDHVLAGPRIRCRLTVVGTGITPEGDGLAEYAGECRVPANGADQDRPGLQP